MPFQVGRLYSKNDIYKILNVPMVQRKGAWNTGYIKYKDDYFLFSNIGIAARTGGEYIDHWDGDYFIWEAKGNSTINQPLIKQLLDKNNNIHLFTRTDNKAPFIYEGKVVAGKFEATIPVKITWILSSDNEQIDEQYPPELSKLNKQYFEGGAIPVMVNKFERNPEARRECIEHYGTKCMVCNFDFYETYGKRGEGFIHVHHIVNLSDIRKNYEVDPIKDLIPVCPNCHSMIHRYKKEVLTIEQVKEIYASNKNG